MFRSDAPIHELLSWNAPSAQLQSRANHRGQTPFDDLLRFGDDAIDQNFGRRECKTCLKHRSLLEGSSLTRGDLHPTYRNWEAPASQRAPMMTRGVTVSRAG